MRFRSCRSTEAPNPVAPVLAALLFAFPANAAIGSADASKQEVTLIAQASVSAEQAPGAGANQKRGVAADLTAPLVYNPPRRGSPRAKVGGGLRGAPALPTLLALAPDHLAQTVSARPALFWYIDAQPTSGAQIVFTLINEDQIDPIAEVRLPTPSEPGIQRIDLARHGVALAPGVEYEWSISLVVDPAQRSRDRITTGYIRRVENPPAFRRELATARVHAENGLWYDALASITDAIEASPGNTALLGQRDDLLRQGNLEAALD
jgi:hypothetical protein